MSSASQAAFVVAFFTAAFGTTGTLDFEEAQRAEQERRIGWCECIQQGHTDSEMEACDRRFDMEDGENLFEENCDE